MSVREFVVALRGLSGDSRWAGVMSKKPTEVTDPAAARATLSRM